MNPIKPIGIQLSTRLSRSFLQLKPGIVRGLEIKPSDSLRKGFTRNFMQSTRRAGPLPRTTYFELFMREIPKGMGAIASLFGILVIWPGLLIGVFSFIRNVPKLHALGEFTTQSSTDVVQYRGLFKKPVATIDHIYAHKDPPLM